MANDNKLLREETCKTSRRAPLCTANAILTSRQTEHPEPFSAARTQNLGSHTARILLTAQSEPSLPRNKNIQASDVRVATVQATPTASPWLTLVPIAQSMLD